MSALTVPPKRLQCGEAFSFGPVIDAASIGRRAAAHGVLPVPTGEPIKRNADARAVVVAAKAHGAAFLEVLGGCVVAVMPDRPRPLPDARGHHRRPHRHPHRAILPASVVAAGGRRANLRAPGDRPPVEPRPRARGCHPARAALPSPRGPRVVPRGQLAGRACPAAFFIPSRGAFPRVPRVRRGRLPVPAARLALLSPGCAA